MDRNSIDWHGPLVALVTPFKKNFESNYSCSYVG